MSSTRLAVPGKNPALMAPLAVPLRPLRVLGADDGDAPETSTALPLPLPLQLLVPMPKLLLLRWETRPPIDPRAASVPHSLSAAGDSLVTFLLLSLRTRPKLGRIKHAILLFSLRVITPDVVPLEAEYRRKARAQDRVFGLALPGPHLNGPNASIGPIEAKLNTVKPIHGIVIGNFGEVSADTHSLVKEIAAQEGRKMYALMGVSPMEAAARIKKQLIDTIGTIAARGYAQLLLARLSALAPIAAQRGNTTNSNQQIISLNAFARAHYRRSIGTRGGAQASRIMLIKINLDFFHTPVGNIGPMQARAQTFCTAGGPAFTELVC
ncbi:hypothetical protein T492DRAFT_887734 [Pavlovales sp. CCMP2436]|nr:hypothetical protein T492DRAFT_887734 [Pavlovales sp. CCMP2436]